MARTLYRIYLYFVSLVLLIVASVGLTILLTNLLLQTPLHGQYESPPDKSSLVQQVVLAATALVVSLALGGLHYWLIRRDIAEDPNAARGAVRSLALNFAQAVTAIVALSTGTSALSDVGRNNGYVVSATFATAIVAVVLFVLLQLERGRSQPADGGPRALELIHLYLLQVILVTVAAIYAWVTAVGDSVTAIFASAGAIPNPCADQNSHYYVYPYNGPTGPGYQQPTCDFPSILAGEWLSLLWMAALLALYIWLARNDRDSVLRHIAHLLGFGVGAIFTIIGIGQAANFVLQGAFGAQSLSASVFVYHFNFIPPLLIGAAVAWGHRFQLERAASASRTGRVGANLTTLAVATLILGVPFYIGVVLVLQGLIERLVPGGSLPDAATWAGDLSVLAAGNCCAVVPRRPRPSGRDAPSCWLGWPLER